MDQPNSHSEDLNDRISEELGYGSRVSFISPAPDLATALERRRRHTPPSVSSHDDPFHALLIGAGYVCRLCTTAMVLI